MNKKRVAYLLSHPIYYFSPLLRTLADYPGIELTVYYCSEEGFKEMQDEGFKQRVKWSIPLFEGYNYKFLKNYSPVPTVFKSLIGLVNPGIVMEIIRNNYDAIIVHGWNYITHILAFLTAILTRTPLFIRAESPLNQELLKSRCKIFLKRFLLGLLFRKISGFLAIGSENKEFYKFYGVPENKIFLTPYTIENERFMQAYEKHSGIRTEIKKENGIPPDKVVILFCGKLIEKKRPFDLLKAYELIDTGTRALVFIGEGILRKQLEEYVKEKRIPNVYFLGFKNQDELPKYYTLADIFVLPSSHGETWGLVVNEAMCFALPVIVTDLVGCGKDLVKHGENGFIYQVGNIHQLAEYLTMLVNDPLLREKMGKRSLEIISCWNIEKTTGGIISALNSLK